ncbi:MAG: hypothetical protein HC906_17040 [Bacteroidales bacterium]|nr:hypothetical protein [Bacteroidales bacterium]
MNTGKHLFLGLIILFVFCCNSYAAINSGDTIVVDFSNTKIVNGMVKIPVSIITDDPVNSIYFSFRIDTNKFSYHSISKYKTHLNSSGNINNSTLYCSAYSLQEIENNTPLFSINLSIKAGNLSVSDIIQYNLVLLEDMPCSIKIIGNYCSGDTLQLNADLTNGEFWLWNTFETTPGIIITNPGKYSCNVFKESGNSIDIIYFLKSYSLPSVSITAESPVPFCDGDSAELLASFENANYYIWSTGDKSRSIYVHEPGNYSLSVYDTNGCQSNNASFDVNIYPKPDSTISVNGSLSFCSGDSVILSVVNKSKLFVFME